MLALCSMLSETYYVQNYAGIIGLGLGQGALPKGLFHVVSEVE